jgi:hypothetical protein
MCQWTDLCIDNANSGTGPGSIIVLGLIVFLVLICRTRSTNKKGKPK